MDAQSLGRYLRQTRETRELTLAEAEQTLKIRSRILESFELGEFNIPDSNQIQIRGFIRNYARFLGLDEAIVIQYYEAALAGGEKQKSSLMPRPGRKKSKRDTQSANAVPTAPRSITDTPPSLPIIPASSLVERRQSTSTILLNLMVRLLVALAAISVIVFVAVQLIDPGFSEQPIEQGTPSNILGDIPPSMTSVAQIASTTPLPLPTVPQTETNYAGQGLLLEIEMVQRGWISISTDGVQQYEGIARPGETLQYSAQNTITMTAANAESLNAIFNGQRQPTFGGRGQRVDVVFSATGVEITTGPGFAPTPIESNTPQPTPTNPDGALIAELTPSATEGPSPTPSMTFTPSETPTITNTPSMTFTPSDTPTITNTPSDTPPPTTTFTASPLPSNTPVPTATFTPSITPTPSPTAILPPRESAIEPSPTKEGN